LINKTFIHINLTKDKFEQVLLNGAGWQLGELVNHLHDQVVAKLAKFLESDF